MLDVLFLASAFVAEVIGTVAGFGSSTVFLPIALQFFDFGAALVLVAIFHMFGNAGRLSFFRKGIDWGLLARFGLPSIAFAVLGAFLVSFGEVPQDLLKAVLGTFLVLYAAFSLAKPAFRIGRNFRNEAFGGALSGFFAGLIGTGGALRGAFISAFKTEKEKYIATTAAISLAVDLTRIPIYLQGGLLAQELYYLVPLLLAAAVAGSFAGKAIVSRIGHGAFKKIVLAAVLLAGLKLAFDGLLNFL